MLLVSMYEPVLSMEVYVCPFEFYFEEFWRFVCLEANNDQKSKWRSLFK